MRNDIWVMLDLNPEPWAVGPASAIRKGGKIIPTIGRNAQLASYKEAVAEQVREYCDLDETDPVYFTGPVKLTIYFWRDRAEYQTPQARAHRKHEADATNLLKATEDALQGIFYKNDKDNHDVRSVIVEQGPSVTPRIIIHVEPCPQFDMEKEIPVTLSYAIQLGQPQLDGM